MGAAPPSHSPDCWIREVGVEAMGSVTLRRRLAVAPAGGPGASARVAEPRSCPILSSRSCSRRSRSMSSGFRAAPWGRERENPKRGSQVGETAAADRRFRVPDHKKRELHPQNKLTPPSSTPHRGASFSSTEKWGRKHVVLELLSQPTPVPSPAVVLP